MEAVDAGQEGMVCPSRVIEMVKKISGGDEHILPGNLLTIYLQSMKCRKFEKPSY